MRILVFTTLYPNAAAPNHGVFVENRLRAYREKYDADVRVIAPVPWFPFPQGLFGHYAKFARAPQEETRDGVTVYHPRYALAPKIGMKDAPDALARCFRRMLKNLRADGWSPDLIDAHYLYPDGVAAAAVAREFETPCVLTARGTDVNLIPKYDEPRERMLGAIAQADAIITVADALKERLIELGAPSGKISTLRNGVDLNIFRPLRRERIRQAMDVCGPVIASVGHLIDRKGHNLVIDAVADIPDATLLIVGDGEEKRALVRQAKQLGLSERVRFCGAVPHQDMIGVYNAADVLVLASSREGWPNVLLEAMACGTPCVATDVWGNGEVISAPSAGCLVKDRTAEAIAEATTTLLNAPPDRNDVRAHAQNHSWGATADGMHEIFSELAEKRARRSTVSTAPISISENARPKLIVTVDTEEIFDWNDFATRDFSLASPDDIDVFQSLCERAGAKPLYLLTYPLLKSSNVACYYWAKVDRGRADGGLHLHPWVTPPDTDFSGDYYSYQMNYPAEIHRQKLQSLAKAYKAAFGRNAVAHRAGRYGVAPDSYPFLSEVGVKYDFSPSAGFDFSKSGGGDFTGYSNIPFTARTPTGDIAVTPVCGARAIRHTQQFLSQEKNAPGFAIGRSRRFTEPARLTPEGSSLDTLIALTRRLVADNAPVLTFTLHSTSLTKGANPYAPDAASVDRMLTVSRDYLSWFQNRLGGEFISLNDLSTLYAEPMKRAA